MPPRLAAKLVAVLLLAQGSSGCLVRLRRDLTPSEYKEIEHCLPWTRTPPYMIMLSPQEVACLRRFSAPLAVPSWP